MSKVDKVDKSKMSRKSSKVTCQGCGKKYKETGYHWHGSFCGYCSEECFKKTGG
jgi:hypothetical protein